MRYSGGGEPSDDLVQVASLGLIGAIDRFDPQRGVPFGAFAGPTILGELRRHFRDRVWTLRVPRGLQERIREVEEAITKLANDYERSPTIAQIAERLEITEDEVLEALEASDARRTMSLDQPTAGDDPGDTSVGDRVGRDDPGFELVEERSALRAGTRALSELEREVLRLRFVDDLTQSKIAARVGYSQMHVSRILRRALERMRATAQADERLPKSEQDGLP
jgi:RNA polymerase sigma-B factor